MNLQIQDTVPSDFKQVQPAESPVDIGTIPVAHPLKYVRTLTLDGIPKAIAGVQEKWPGNGEAYVWFEPDALDHFLSFGRIIKYDLLPVADAAFRRITAPVDVNNDAAVRFVQWLGFHREFDQPLAHFGLNGEGDYWQYVRFP